MSQTETLQLLGDIVAANSLIKKLVQGLNYNEFVSQTKKVEDFKEAFLAMSIAIKTLPENLKKANPDIIWDEIAQIDKQTDICYLWRSLDFFLYELVQRVEKLIAQKEQNTELFECLESLIINMQEIDFMLQESYSSPNAKLEAETKLEVLMLNVAQSIKKLPHEFKEKCIDVAWEGIEGFDKQKSTSLFLWESARYFVNHVGIKLKRFQVKNNHLGVMY
ncbi:hypothetical protein LCX93_11470 [Sulfurimonas sp. SWIR-19]|uniref:hypothetical protein n=1 Tax=Sulfurimonas sp. SWIR-19 TaxID=2878390 RepID=UPI001CF2144F|nr:hypothetical protein [Sulfurimonas sp. SWIR-19]UCN00130.1 hypothetical protein LCX93_11470 [Sulfurimonas sp. SWIR-19]